ncbi:MAG: FAD-dependent oxidoreductase, partial [Thermodesulfobacteriota bacterium]|nr:FAD-dependent oxidoreductase [Thermodesulfobacteriota bacterium]
MYDVFDFEGCVMDRVNLREQVLWSMEPPNEDTGEDDDDDEEDTQAEDIQMMAEDYIRMGITKVKKMELPEGYKPEQDMSKDILVVGGGITGLTSALETAKAGYNVVLVEKEAELGGFQKNVRKKVTFPYKEVMDNNLGQLIQSVRENDKIKVYTGAEVEKTTGSPCLFQASIKQGEETVEHNIGAIVLAPGWTPYDPAKLDEKLGFGKSPNVITNTMFEEQNKASEKLGNVVFLQCAGSRDPDHLPYCSSVCCLASLKQAVQIKENNPKANVFVVYKELRTPGQIEDFYRKAQEMGVIFIRCQDPKVLTGDGLGVEADDEILGETVEIPDLDLVVLATGMVPVTALGEDIKAKPGAEGEEAPPPPSDSDMPPVPPDVIRASDCLNLEYRQGPELPDLKYGFPDSHFICFPFESRRTGIYAAGCVRRPMNSASAFEDAAGAAMKAIQCIELTSRGAAVHPRAGDLSFPEFFMQRCTQCKRCTDECPFGAINEDAEGNPLPQPTRCRRCGVCMGACPERIISF